ncbi:MAG: shikimate kinase [Bacteroidales bacterium]|jgi:shikimate kinase|nr:shikimate kinase [Bacteroidales bacterium]
MRIFLIGFPASGKSYWGKELAQKLKLPFIDLDCIIETDYEMSISEIFHIKGESVFRKIEHSALEAQISNQGTFVMACGGGIMGSETNRQLLKSTGITVFIDTPTQTIINRLLQDTTGNRPLLSNLTSDELQLKVKRMMNERRKAYETAEFSFYPERETLNDLVNKLQ